ncbi:hypothetical protein PUN28_015760 [Cardiocondyla obscurior]|uniref:Uncharacterized protein n=1 Tax=Cardiocondyla obscurior TaxID=286306 RepID=A0AAW2EZV3_9HYME
MKSWIYERNKARLTAELKRLRLECDEPIEALRNKLKKHVESNPEFRPMAKATDVQLPPHIAIDMADDDDDALVISTKPMWIPREDREVTKSIWVPKCYQDFQSYPAGTRSCGTETTRAHGDHGEILKQISARNFYPNDSEHRCYARYNPEHKNH